MIEKNSKNTFGILVRNVFNAFCSFLVLINLPNMPVTLSSIFANFIYLIPFKD